MPPNQIPQWEDIPWAKLIDGQRDFSKILEELQKKTNIFDNSIKITQNDTHFLVLVDLPGCQDAEVDMPTNTRIVVWGHRQESGLPGTEVIKVNYTKEIKLPSPAIRQTARADLKDGLLRIKLEKNNLKENTTIKVDKL